MQEILQQLEALFHSAMAKQLETLFLGSVPTILLFIVLVMAYQFLVQGPLTATLKERRARTEGAQENAQNAISLAEKQTAEYASRLRLARAEVFKLREQRVRQWNAERDAALDATRKAAGERVRQAKAELESEAADARRAVEASAGDLARRVVQAVLPQATGGAH